MTDTHTLPVESNVVALVSKGIRDGSRGSLRMPDVLGATIGSAVDKLERQGVTVQVTLDYTDDVPANRVYAQYPAAGGSAMLGSIVVLLVSKGRRRGEVVERGVLPAIVGMNSYEAEEAIRRAGLTPMLIETHHPSAPSGEVVAQLPSLASLSQVPNMFWVRSRPLLLALAAFIAALSLLWFFFAPVIVPEVTGLQEEVARKELTRAGFRVGATRTASLATTAEEGEVVAQIPANGAPLRRGSTVIITVAGPMAKALVPDLAGRTRLQYELALQTVGLTGKAVKQPSETVKKGFVISTDPAAGKSVERGQVITIYVSTGKP